MQTNVLTNEANLSADSNKGNHSLRVVIAYNDIAAGKRAMCLLTEVGRKFGDDIRFESIAWSFDLLADIDWRAVAASDAVKADILIITTSDGEPLPPTIGRWAEDAICGKRGTDAAVVALFGPGDNPDGPDSNRLAAIRVAAQRAGLDFFAPTPIHELNQVIEQIHLRAEMITPVLNRILNHP